MPSADDVVFDVQSVAISRSIVQLHGRLLHNNSFSN